MTDKDLLLEWDGVHAPLFLFKNFFVDIKHQETFVIKQMEQEAVLL